MLYVNIQLNLHGLFWSTRKWSERRRWTFYTSAWEPLKSNCPWSVICADKHLSDLRPLHRASLIFEFLQFTSIYVVCCCFIIKAGLCTKALECFLLDNPHRLKWVAIPINTQTHWAFYPFAGNRHSGPYNPLNFYETICNKYRCDLAVMSLLVSFLLNCLDFLINQASLSKNGWPSQLMRYDTSVDTDASNQSLTFSVNGP